MQHRERGTTEPKPNPDYISNLNNRSHELLALTLILGRVGLAIHYKHDMLKWAPVVELV